MNCYFCQKSIIKYNAVGGGICYNCPTQVYHTRPGPDAMICMYHNTYTIALVINENYSFILNDKQEYLAKMNYIPNVNPQNHTQYINKILKLKAFL